MDAIFTPRRPAVKRAGEPAARSADGPLQRLVSRRLDRRERHPLSLASFMSRIGVPWPTTECVDDWLEHCKSRFYDLQIVPGQRCSGKALAAASKCLPRQTVGLGVNGPHRIFLPTVGVLGLRFEVVSSSQPFTFQIVQQPHDWFQVVKPGRGGCPGARPKAVTPQLLNLRHEAPRCILDPRRDGATFSGIVRAVLQLGKLLGGARFCTRNPLVKGELLPAHGSPDPPSYRSTDLSNAAFLHFGWSVDSIVAALLTTRRGRPPRIMFRSSGLYNKNPRAGPVGAARSQPRGTAV